MQDAVERAIDTMWTRYHEPLSLADMATPAILSKFYFSRVFRGLTGTSPGRFLTAIRLSRAKQLLLETRLSVTEISYSVGYNSLGTFTSRFTRSVGVSPARYRALSAEGLLSLSALPRAQVGPATGAVRGWVDVPEGGRPVRVYVAAFADPIAQGVPRACDTSDGSGPYRFDALPEGVWYLRAAVVALDDPEPRPWRQGPALVAAADRVEVAAGRTTEVDLSTRPTSALDLPILLALPELDSAGLAVATGS
ncbi:helix-turn-helix transcriptional regulator [Actinosynnema pretiosum subsp. pretiosum]|uniref:Helix-turn-helix transcriptional regulator n=1 Tax=Actinosynnema pretiosum subsp. pretiosum TaxID=103721 RepID=A0AA45L7B6_9PSEU|nr:transcriptional regulator, AraC family [Actinosynnema pretiosum subsp. pretiosum]QUF04505.1 helix-turn-helix transcriptional regulator [Actinosynnema pretiosum subsp. pretiosum]